MIPNKICIKEVQCLSRVNFSVQSMTHIFSAKQIPIEAKQINGEKLNVPLSLERFVYNKKK